MLSPALRVVLIAGAFALGAGAAFRGEPEAVLWFAGGAVILFAHLRVGGARAAFAALSRGNLASAKKHLERTRFERLNAEHRALYRWVEAGLAEAGGDLAGARTKLEEALAEDALPRAQRPLCLCTLGAVCYRLGDTRRAKQLADEAEALAKDERTRRVVAKLRDTLKRA